MAVQELVTRVFTGKHREDGTPVYATTQHGRPRPPQSVAEWAEQRVAALNGTSGAASRAVVRLLLADGDQAVRAAVAAGRDLSEMQRWAVLQTLEKCKEIAREYPPATGLMDQLVTAWTAKHGSEQPRGRTA